MYDIIVIGAGPAGLTSAVYARRADKTVLVLEQSTFGGQITHAPCVENYPGFVQMSGTELGDKLIDQALTQGADIELDTVLSVEKTGDTFTVHGKEADYTARAVIIAVGSRHRQLGLPGENELVGEGVSYCAVCDGAFYRDKTVALIGGGNSALQEAVLLSGLCRKVFLVQNLPFLTGEVRLQEKIREKDNIEVILSSVVTAILRNPSFAGITISENGHKRDLTVDGMFVAIGLQPENEPFRSLLSLDEAGYIQSGENCVPDGACPGVFVAGDCRTKSVRQLTTAVGDGAVAAVAACRFLDAPSSP